MGEDWYGYLIFCCEAGMEMGFVVMQLLVGIMEERLLSGRFLGRGKDRWCGGVAFLDGGFVRS